MSTCLCAPEPDKELVDKYEDMKATFYKRILAAYGKVQAAVVPLAEGMEHGSVIKEYATTLHADPKMQSAIKALT